MQRERGAQTSGAYHWLLLSEGGGGLKEERMKRGDGRECVGRKKGNEEAR